MVIPGLLSTAPLCTTILPAAYLKVQQLSLTVSLSYSEIFTIEIVKPRLHERFFLIVASPALVENHRCSHPRASAAMATAKNRRKKIGRN